MRGKVKFFDEEKGFGFIIGEEKEYFAHISNVFKKIPLEEGQYVFFDVKKTDKGPKAVNIDIDISVKKND